MAIVYTTGTINQPDAGSVGLAMVERIRDDVSAHAAWDVVEEFTAASGTVRWYILRCLATQSGLPSDYYVVIGRTLSDGSLRAFICESYTLASHVAKYYCPYGYGSSYAYDDQGRYTPDYILGAGPLAAVAAAPAYMRWVPSGTSTKWWISVSEDGFTVAFNGAANGVWHVGAYTPLTVLPITLPIQMCGSDNQPSISWGSITRNPAIANLSFNGSALFFEGGGGVSSTIGQYLGFSSDLRYNDKLQGGQRPVAEQGMNIYQQSTGDMAVSGHILGKHKRMRVTRFSLPVGVAFGDAYVLQGRLWVPYLPTDFRMFDTGMAAS